jgi:hypothetical protein
MRAALIAHRPSPTSQALAARTWNGTPIEVLSPRDALLRLERGDIALVRLDIREDLGGIEEGLSAVERLVDQGVRVLNPPSALVRAHDKVLTARTLRRAGLPHPQTRLIEHHREPPELDFPVVVKPRFGSWGREVTLCSDPGELERTLERLSFRDWFRSDRGDRAGTDPAARARPAPDRGRRQRDRGRPPHGGARRVADERRARRDRLARLARARCGGPGLRRAAASGLDLVGVDLLPTGLAASRWWS